MVAYNFKDEFAGKVESGMKRQTIRAHRKRHARPGERLQLYSRMRRKDCRKLVHPDPQCVSVEPIHISMVDGTLAVQVNGRDLDEDWRTDLARADGFESDQEMGLFFKSAHGLPFSGVLIRWE
ncbi:hypothetical protein [Maridesulfovibrio sp. FT414]|uniref:hypothetical protein n=1 Tax=Maridesulfovibrio sp. FT414 TaxID=2979469 RepID=UPI003D806CC0